MAAKTYLDTDVYSAARARLHKIYDEFDHVQVSFSGGKDSTVLLHLAIEVATERNRLPVRAMFIDLEGQYQETIRHITEMFDDPRVDGTWFCLPLNLRNAVSQFQPHWACWDPGLESEWVRPLPQHRTVVSDPAAFPFFRYRMEFEEFVPEYEQWLAEQLGGKLAVLVGIRSDESLNRFRTIKRDNVRRHNGWKWSTAWSESCVNLYPIYDWRVEDIWTYLGRKRVPYNRLYDWMYLHGASIHEQRICQPYGDDQRVSLDQFHAIEPETWFRILKRVQGVNHGALYANQRILGYRRGLGLPPGHTWKSYTKLLLKSLPPDIEAHYREKFLVWIRWWKNHRRDYGHVGMLESGVRDSGTRKLIPSWERLALCILKNDYWCHSLTFGATKRIFERQQELKEKYKLL